MDIKNNILQAAAHIKPYVEPTPLVHARQLSQYLDCQVYLKLENMTHIGAFKIRGAMNKLLLLTAKQKANGIIAASTGNHGAAIAYGLAKLGIKGTIFVPKQAAKTKINNIKSFQGHLRIEGDDAGVTEEFAKQYAKSHDMIYVSPYNDPQVIAGQGTIGVELVAQLEKIDAVLVPVGGGGLISGIAGYLKSVQPEIQMVACLPENSPVMYECVKAGKIIDLDVAPTLSDATAGNIEHDAITFDLCRQFVDDYVLTSEAEIKNALRLFIDMQHLLVEGAVGVALAALIKSRQHYQGKNVVIIVSGGNISVARLKSVIC